MNYLIIFTVMVPGPGPKPSQSRNLLKSIENNQFVGPISALKKYKDTRVRIKVCYFMVLSA